MVEFSYLCLHEFLFTTFTCCSNLTLDILIIIKRRGVVSFLRSTMKKEEFVDRLIEMILLKDNRESIKDVNQNKLSKKIGVPPATFHQWLTGAFPKRIDHWKKIQKYFNCDLNYLITGIEQDKKTIPNEGVIIVSDDKKKLMELNFNILDHSEIKIIAK